MDDVAAIDSRRPAQRVGESARRHDDPRPGRPDTGTTEPVLDIRESTDQREDAVRRSDVRRRTESLEAELAHERRVVAQLEDAIEAARGENRLELVAAKDLRERDARERDAISRYSNAEGRWYELTVQLQRERDRTDELVREVERLRAVLTPRQRRKLGIN